MLKFSSFLFKLLRGKKNVYKFPLQLKLLTVVTRIFYHLNLFKIMRTFYGRLCSIYVVVCI